MAAGGYDRLSDLSDDLLRHILHFAPLKEAASTTALSRRWRALLWLSSGTLNLQTGIDDDVRCIYRPDDIVTAAAGALDAVDVPVTRLTMRHDQINVVSDYAYTELVDAVLSHRAVRRIEELRLVTKKASESYHYGYREGLYEVTLDSLPLGTLRILELTNCKGILYQRDHAVIPRLSSLRLSHCVQQLGSLQRIIDDAPELAAVHLESVIIHTQEEEGKKAATRRLRCPAANVLVLDSCTEGHYSYYTNTVHIDEINAPRLRHFRYKGALRSFSFSPPPLELEQVDLHFVKQAYEYEWNKKDLDRDLETFWRFARSFTSTKELRLRVNHLEDIAVLTEARWLELLLAFPRLERLEVQGVHYTEGTTATVTAILNLLRCCPALCALQINLIRKHENDTNNKKGYARDQYLRGVGFRSLPC